MRKVTKGKVTIKLWDLGGQPRFRSMWERYCRGVSAIVYVVDSADADNIATSKSELHDLLAKPALEGIPTLILGNKNDLPASIGVDELIERLGLKSLANREVRRPRRCSSLPRPPVCFRCRHLSERASLVRAAGVLLLDQRQEQRQHRHHHGVACETRQEPVVMLGAASCVQRHLFDSPHRVDRELIVVAVVVPPPAAPCHTHTSVSSRQRASAGTAGAPGQTIEAAAGRSSLGGAQLASADRRRQLPLIGRSVGA